MSLNDASWFVAGVQLGFLIFWSIDIYFERQERKEQRLADEIRKGRKP